LPSKSKAQQRFMGLVHSYKKGEVPASKVSKAVKDAAKSMDTKSVKKYASTKHKGKPEKVNKEFVIKKIRELLDSEMESCGYTMSAKDPSYKLKSPGGTGDEDRRLKEVVTEGEKEKIEKLLIKYGNTPEDAKQMISKTYDYIKKAYRNANASKKAEIMSGLMKFETTEDFGNLVEKCWKGYMIHPKRKTKKLFGKTYPNCVKKENVNRLTEMDYRGFIKYMNDFYGPKGIYPDKKKRTLGQKEIGMAYSVLLKKKPNFEIGFDSTDREMLRDILIKMRKLDPNYSKKESVNEKMRPAVKKLLKQKGYGPIFQAIDNSKRQFKQMRYSRGEIQDTLIDMFGKEDPKILQKIKESVNEAVDKKQGAEILNQLGGNRFIMMTGAKHFGVGKEGLSFKIGRNSKQVNHIKIDYDRGRDLYNIKFDWVTKRGIKNKKTLKGVYADQLQKVFTMHTGMYTSL
tara:strand:- start:3265 stop:4635 length:1371 start_codon:yes stop_codon:yes gene_type:complete